MGKTSNDYGYCWQKKIMKSPFVLRSGAWDLGRYEHASI